MALTGLSSGSFFGLIRSPSASTAPGFLSGHGTGQVEKGTPVLLVKGLRISPFEDGDGHFEPPAGWRFGAVCADRVENSGLVPSMQALHTVGDLLAPRSAFHSSTRFRAPRMVTGWSGSEAGKLSQMGPGWSHATGRRTPRPSTGRSRLWPYGDLVAHGPPCLPPERGTG